MADTATPFVSIGTVANRLGVSPSMVVRWEKTGRIPIATRVEAGTIRRRVWSATQLAEMEMSLAERRASKPASAG